jgi:hypothetical protein
MRFRKFLHGVVVSSALICMQVQAAPQACAGTMSNLWVAADGSVYVLPSWRGDYIRLCNTDVNLGAVTPATCMTWISLVRSAVQRQAQTIIYFAEAPVCNLIPTYYNSPAVYYVMLNN